MGGAKATAGHRQGSRRAGKSRNAELGFRRSGWGVQSAMATRVSRLHEWRVPPEVDSDGAPFAVHLVPAHRGQFSVELLVEP